MYLDASEYWKCNFSGIIRDAKKHILYLSSEAWDLYFYRLFAYLYLCLPKHVKSYAHCLQKMIYANVVPYKGWQYASFQYQIF